MENHPHIKRIHWYILVLTVVVFGLVWWSISKTEKEPQKQEKEIKVSSQQVGSITLKDKEDLRKYKVGKPIVLQFIADSGNYDVVGFDVLLQYDRNAFSLTSTQIALSGFRVFPRQEKDHLWLTGIQGPESNTRSVLKNESILNLTLLPKKTGSYTFTLLKKSGKETTKLVDIKTEILYPKTSSLKIQVE